MRYFRKDFLKSLQRSLSFNFGHLKLRDLAKLTTASQKREQ